MTNLEIQKYIEDNLRNCQGGKMMDEQIFYEGAKWYRDRVVNKLPVQGKEITISIQSELLLAVICEYNKINTQKEIIEVEKWIVSNVSKQNL